jgi:hypothetical protein
MRDDIELSEVDETEIFSGVEGAKKIYCANCIHCKLVPAASHTNEQYLLRVRCEMGKWRKKLGEEKIYKYFTVARRSIPGCDAYEDMGESEDFIRDLKKSLPIKDELYSY